VAKGRIGLDVGSTAVRAAEVVPGGDQPSLVRAAQVPLPPGAVQNGEIRDSAQVAQAIRELWERGGFKERQVIMGVGNQQVVVREITVPSLPPKELRQSLPFQVQNLIPIPVEDAVLDFDVVEELEQEGNKMVRLMVVAAQKGMINDLMNAANGGKVEPVGIDLVPFALIRAVGQDDGLGLEEADFGAEALVDVGADISNICVHDRGVARFVRILPSGGRDVTVSMATALGIPEDDAEALKRGQVVEGGPPSEEVEGIRRTRAATLVDEIRSSLDFFRAQTPGAEVSKVMVTGGGSKLEGFMELLDDRIDARVEPGRAFRKVAVRLDMDEETKADAEPLLAVALGLALPQA
jgi:type IV pilus assembly protein PilM